VNETLNPEEVISSELGYGYLSKKMKIDLTVYRTEWNDKGYTESTGQGGFAKSDGIDALHQGVELETRIKATKKFRIELMGSYGDWRWVDNAVFDYYDRDQNYVRTAPVYIKDVSVGGSAQTTAALGIEYHPFPEFKIGADFNHYSRLYSDFDVEERITEENEGVNAWQMPDYQLVDVNARYDFDIAGFDATIYGNIYNILDTEYISYALDGRNHDVFTSPVYFGFGRTWSLALKLRF
jgi:outer membrane receptor protein involved in Fe transport